MEKPVRCFRFGTLFSTAIIAGLMLSPTLMKASIPKTYKLCIFLLLAQGVYIIHLKVSCWFYRIMHDLDLCKEVKYRGFRLTTFTVALALITLALSMPMNSTKYQWVALTLGTAIFVVTLWKGLNYLKPMVLVKNAIPFAIQLKDGEPRDFREHDSLPTIHPCFTFYEPEG